MTDKIIDSYERGDRGEQVVRATLSDFKGQDYFSLRAWYPDETREYKPTKNGINLPVDEFPAFVDLVLGIASHLPLEIDDLERLLRFAVENLGACEDITPEMQLALKNIATLLDS